MDDEYLGVIKLWAGSFIPRNFLPCNGETLEIAQYQALFALIGTYYGGDGVINFNLPDLRGIVPIGMGHKPGLSKYDLGNSGGNEYTTLTNMQLPSHTHEATFTPIGNPSPIEATVSVNAGTGGTPTNDPTNAYWGRSPETGPPQARDYTNKKNVKMAEDAVQVEVSGGGILGGEVRNFDTGNGAPFMNMQPYLALNYIICVVGLFPSRSES